jgi:8-oxo-dGTP pyrophosphatase MutT (NUDIX family)
MTEPKLLPAATLLLVRDAPTFEVLMVERHHQIDFASGALVFPGGKVAAGDSDPRWADHITGADDLSTADRALQISAIREGFEESGLLLAYRRAKGAGLARDADIAPIAPLRDAIAKGEASFLEAVASVDLVLALDQVLVFAHWITPKGMPKRFDTWFYLARAPEGQTALHDGGEAVDSVWIAPNDAVAAAQRGERKIIFPTRLNLELLGRALTASEALAQTKARAIKTVEPWIEQGDDGPELVIDPTAGYGAVREALSSNMP